MKSKSRIWEICFNASWPLDGCWEEHDRESQACEWNRTGDEWSYCLRFFFPLFPEYELLYHDKRQDRYKWHIYILPSKRNLTQSRWKQLWIWVSTACSAEGEAVTGWYSGNMQCLFRYIMKDIIAGNLPCIVKLSPHVCFKTFNIMCVCYKSHYCVRIWLTRTGGNAISYLCKYLSSRFATLFCMQWWKVVVKVHLCKYCKILYFNIGIFHFYTFTRLHPEVTIVLFTFYSLNSFNSCIYSIVIDWTIKQHYQTLKYFLLQDQ